MTCELAFVDSIGEWYDEIEATFGVVASNGWPAADTGETWTVSGTAANYSGSGSAGLMSMASVNVARLALIGSAVGDIDVMAHVRIPVLATGAPINAGVVARYVDASNFFLLRVRVSTAQVVTLVLSKMEDGALSDIQTYTTSLVHTTAMIFGVRLQIRNNLLRGRAWDTAGDEPSVWHVSATDAAHPTGTVGCRAILETSNSNALPVSISFDNFLAQPAMQMRLDLNEEEGIHAQAGTVFAPPQLRRAVSSTMLTDGDHIAASAYGNRSITLALDMTRMTRDEAAAAIQQVSREVNRATNFLRYRADTTHAVFFRTFRSDYSSIIWDAVQQKATVQLLAEPFAYGEPVILDGVEIGNDPNLGGGVVNANPYMDTNVTDWTPTGGTFVYQTSVIWDGAGSGLLTPNGVATDVSILSGQHTSLVAPGMVMRAAAQVRCPFARNVKIGVSWYSSAGSLLSTSETTTAVVANTWTALSVTGTAPASAARAALRIMMSSTPLVTHLLYVDDAELIQPGAPQPMYWDISDVKGDVEASLRIHEDTLVFYDSTFLIATRRRGNPANVEHVLQAEAATQGTDTTTQTFDPVMSGSAANNYSRCTFGTIAMTARLTWANWPTLPSVDARGTYRALLRCRQNTPADAINIQLSLYLAGSSSGPTLSTVAMPNISGFVILDMGLVQMPYGVDPVTNGPSGIELENEPFGLRISAQRVSGAGTLDMDYMLLIPADDQLAIVDVGDDTDGGGYVMDSFHDLMYATNGGRVDQSGDIVPVGAFPSLLPGATNRLYLVQGVARDGVNTGIDEQARMTVTYWPRYIHVRPVIEA